MFVISRPINGVTLNGKEYALDPNTGEVAKFDSVADAKMFLAPFGITEMDIIADGITFDEV